jgi:hypothetical protein
VNSIIKGILLELIFDRFQALHSLHGVIGAMLKMNGFN